MASLLTRLRQPLAASRFVTARSFITSTVHRNASAVDDNTFPVLSDPLEHDTTLPTFMVGRKNGFLPRQDPLVELPEEYKVLESLLQRMPLQLSDGSHGLLHSGQLFEAVHSELPLYDVSNVKDQRMLSALYRDYTFLASAYLLEPCDLLHAKTGKYGLGRSVLPRNIAVPLQTVADKINARPFMEYALSYALYNYKRADPSKGLDFDNLRLIRAFAGSKSELGFIGNHVSMVQHSGPLVSHAVDMLDACAQQNRPAFDSALRGLSQTYQIINDEMEMMWKRSAPEDYMKFRTFIYGTKGQSFFPYGVIYEGVSDKPQFYRGESGANDSMVPLGDNILELTSSMPKNPLTEVLRDFRSYRPTNHRDFIEWTEKRAKSIGVKKFAEQDANSAALYLANVDQIRAFRHRHWNFTKSYILKFTKHPTATGGSPIVTWLPNQLGNVLSTMIAVGQGINKGDLTSENRELVEELGRRADTQKKVLMREVEELKKVYKDQENVVV